MYRVPMSDDPSGAGPPPVPRVLDVAAAMMWLTAVTTLVNGFGNDSRLRQTVAILSGVTLIVAAVGTQMRSGLAYRLAVKVTAWQVGAAVWASALSFSMSHLAAITAPALTMILLMHPDSRSHVRRHFHGRPTRPDNPYPR